MRSYPRYTAGLGILALLAASAACATHSSNAASNENLERPRARVTVVNRHWNPVRVYALRGHAQHRLGTVSSMSSDRFTLPEYLYKSNGHVILHVQPVGSSEGFTSGAIPCEPGARIEWRIHNILRYSSAMVY